MNLRTALWLGICALIIDGTLFAQQQPSVSYAESQTETNTSASRTKLKPSSLAVFGSWRFRAEAWDWFRPTSDLSSYGFVHSLLRAGLSQSRERFEWLVEGAQDTILGLPANAVAPGNQGQLGLGGTYFVANQDRQNIASGFLKQGYLGIRLPLNGKLILGRFGFSDGVELKPTDATLAEVVNTRVAQRLIGEFNFSAVMRSFDGVHLSVDQGKNNLTLLAVRPTEGAYQVDAMGELNIDLFYGAFTVPTQFHRGTGELRLFALGYLDQRKGVVNTDNRPVP